MLAKSVLWLVQLCPPRMAWWISGWIAHLAFWSGNKVARFTRINIQLCFPDLTAEEVRTLTLSSLQHMMLLLFEFSQLAFWPQDKLLGQIVRVEGRELLEQAVAKPGGTLLLVPHFGNWEILCAFLGVHYSLAALYDPPNFASLEPVIVDVRERYKGRMFPIDTGGMRSLIKVLKEGGLVAILPDQVPDRNAGVHVDFFGHPALTMSLPHRLMTKNRPNVLMGSVQREITRSGYQYILRFEPGPCVGETDQHTAQALNNCIEHIVRRDPAQYQWEYKRFKRPPDGSRSSVYRRQ